MTRWKLVARLAATVGTVVATVGVVPAAQAQADGQALRPAKSSGTQATTYLINRANGGCLTGNDGHLFVAACHYGPSQQWNFGASTGWTTLRNVQSGLCVDGTASTGRMYLLGCNGGDFQQFAYNGYAMIPQKQSANCMRSNSAGSVWLSSACTWNDGYFIWDK